MEHPQVIVAGKQQRGFFAQVAVNVTTALIVTGILYLISMIFGD